MSVNLSGEPDSFKWSLTTTCIFSVKSMYADYMNGHTIFLKKIPMEDKGTTKNTHFHVVPL
jgi:hypothetical protein